MSSTISRHYEPAPAPQPPDEQYWAALLSQADEAEDSPGEDRNWLDELDAINSAKARHYPPINSHNQDWQQAEQTYRDDGTVELKVTGFNRGGLLVEWGSLRGFVPASQLIQTHDLHDLSTYVGEMLPLRVIEISRVQNRLILSQRAAQVLPGTRASILQNLSCNTCVRGVVTNICDFGAFIDLGGVEGLIHISELSWGRVEHPAELLHRGQELSVFIMSLDRDEGRIALSLKRLQPDPWITVEARYQVGQQIESVITSVVDFGAFACLEQGLEGLIHISELAEGHFMHPRNVVQTGQRVIVRILNIDSRARRIGLSLRMA